MVEWSRFGMSSDVAQPPVVWIIVVHAGQAVLSRTRRPCRGGVAALAGTFGRLLSRQIRGVVSPAYASGVFGYEDCLDEFVGRPSGRAIRSALTEGLPLVMIGPSQGERNQCKVLETHGSAEGVHCLGDHALDGRTGCRRRPGRRPRMRAPRVPLPRPRISFRRTGC